MASCRGVPSAAGLPLGDAYGIGLQLRGDGCAGSTQPRQSQYFRIQGASFLID
jgi:hypothetical protein